MQHWREPHQQAAAFGGPPLRSLPSAAVDRRGSGQRGGGVPEGAGEGLGIHGGGGLVLNLRRGGGAQGRHVGHTPLLRRRHEVRGPDARRCRRVLRTTPHSLSVPYMQRRRELGIAEAQRHGTPAQHRHSRSGCGHAPLCTTEDSLSTRQDATDMQNYSFQLYCGRYVVGWHTLTFWAASWAACSRLRTSGSRWLGNRTPAAAARAHAVSGGRAHGQSTPSPSYRETHVRQGFTAVHHV